MRNEGAANYRIARRVAAPFSVYKFFLLPSLARYRQ